jgi:lipopolysaccharide transport system permease protein
MLVYGVMPTWNLLAVVPLLALAGLQALAVGLWLGPINVRFRDIKYTLPFLIQIWMYASPIVYPLSLIPKEWHWLYSLNPMVGVIEGFRWAIAGGTFNLLPLLISGAVGSVLIVGGLIFFKHMERTFADVI